MVQSQNEVGQWLHIRAIEWTNWPTYLSQPIVPLLLISYRWFIVLPVLACLEVGWAFVRYKYVSVTAANYGAVFVEYTKWPAALLSAIVLLVHHRYLYGALAIGWPLGLTIPLCMFGKIGKVERLFALKVGLDDPESVRDRIIQLRQRATDLMNQIGLRPNVQYEVMANILFGRWNENAVVNFLESQVSKCPCPDEAQVMAEMHRLCRAGMVDPIVEPNQEKSVRTETELDDEDIPF